ncbi:unnamed protein product [Brassica rapa subsp. trilocularis]
MPSTTANIPYLTTVFKSGVRCRWESTPASSFEPSICKVGVRCRWESTPAFSSEPSKASKVMLSAHNSHFLLCRGEYFITMSSFYEWRKFLGFFSEL